MSTIIRNGYELPSHLTLESLLSWSQGVRQRLTQCAKEHLEAAALRRAVALFDEATLRVRGHALTMQPSDLDCGCLYQALSSLREEVKQARQERRFCPLEPETSLAVIPDGDRLYGLLYCEIPQVREAFAREEGVKGYAYSNQTDGPSDMTHEQWSARGEHWDRLLGPTGVPSNVSTTIHLVPDTLLYELDFSDDEAAFQELASPRALKKRAQHLALYTDAAQLPEDMQAEFEKSKSLGVWMRHHMNLLDGKVPAFDEEVEKIMGQLIPAPTLGQLRAPQPAPRLLPQP